jgi:NADPH2:quinone reductase
MRQIAARGPEAKDLVVEETDVPHPGEGETLVRVAAVGLNRSDLKQRRRGRPPAGVDTDILGIEFSGTVVEVPRGSGLSVGDEVCGLVPGGAYAEYVTVRAGHLLPLPQGCDLIEAAAVPEAFLTAHTNMVSLGRLGSGERVLIHGGASGVGTAAIQIARWLGAEVFVTVSTPEKARACRELGANHAVLYTECDFVEEVQRLTDGQGVDVIVDIVGAAYLQRNLGLLRMDGRLIFVSLLQGSEANLDLSVIQKRRITLTGSQLRSRTTSEKDALTRRLHDEVWPGFRDGSLRPVIDSVHPFASVSSAHLILEENRNIGKVLLEL